MNWETSFSIGNMSIYGNSRVQTTLPRLAGRWTGRILGSVKEEPRVLTTGADDLHLTSVTSTYFVKQEPIFCGTTRAGTTSGEHGTDQIGSEPTTIFANTICDGCCGILRFWPPLNRQWHHGLHPG